MPPSTASEKSTITLTPHASAHPAAEQVRGLLQRHFEAINSHDYDAWTPRAGTAPREEWLEGYRTTQDDSVVVSDIRSVGPQDVSVELTFVSNQDPADAPADLPVAHICWYTELPIDNINGDGRIGPAIQARPRNPRVDGQLPPQAAQPSSSNRTQSTSPGRWAEVGAHRAEDTTCADGVEDGDGAEPAWYPSAVPATMPLTTTQNTTRINAEIGHTTFMSIPFLPLSVYTTWWSVPAFATSCFLFPAH
jgi:hypothetical protein